MNIRLSAFPWVLCMVVENYAMNMNTTLSKQTLVFNIVKVLFTGRMLYAPCWTEYYVLFDGWSDICPIMEEFYVLSLISDFNDWLSYLCTICMLFVHCMYYLFQCCLPVEAQSF